MSAAGEDTHAAPTARVLGLGLGTPSRTLNQREAAAMASPLCAAAPAQARTLERIYRNARVERRGAAALERNGDAPFYPPPNAADDRGPTTRARNEAHLRCAAPMAQTAARGALERASTRSGAITHLVTASCTGFAAPGIDAHLVRALGLSPAVERAHLGFMGCHAAISALRVARALAMEDPGARVLLCCVEVCSVHLQYGWDMGQVVAGALFADGAGAAVVAQSADEGAPAIRSTSSRLLADDPEAMGWTIGDHGFEMTLAARAPEMIEASLAGWVRPWLASQGRSPEREAAWAVHPGGPRVLEAVERALALPGDALDASREVLREHGNMSSATLLFILDRLLHRGADHPCVAIAFGPGLWAEGALLV